VNSARASHEALQRLAARGKDFTDNDLKEALVHLRQLEQDYAAATSRIVEAMSGNLRREIMELRPTRKTSEWKRVPVSQA
jgi:hypothetical protein